MNDAREDELPSTDSEESDGDTSENTIEKVALRAAAAVAFQAQKDLPPECQPEATAKAALTTSAAVFASYLVKGAPDGDLGSCSGLDIQDEDPSLLEHIDWDKVAEDEDRKLQEEIDEVVALQKEIADLAVTDTSSQI